MPRTHPGHTVLIALAGLAVVAAGGRAQTDPRAQIFVQRGCTECHAVSALRVKAAADVGPDLTYAYGDVVCRYGVNLESFMANPAGVMRMMLAAHVGLTVADRDSIVHVLRELYGERRADSEAGMPSLRPPRPRTTAQVRSWPP